MKPTIAALEALLRRPGLDPGKRDWIRRDLRFVVSGSKTERDAAYQIELHFGRSPHWATLHNLRFEIDGYAAQIDHLVINRLAEIWVCESKSLSEGAVINKYGEWQRSWQGELIGMKSPVEQVNRQVLLLTRVFDDGLVDAPRRLGLLPKKPRIRGLVLVSDKAWIDRPDIDAPWLDEIIKAEHLRTRLYDAYDQASPLHLLGLIGKGSLATMARQIAALHHPIDVDWPARFGVALEPKS